MDKTDGIMYYYYKFISLDDVPERKSEILQLALEELDDISIKWFTLCDYHDHDFERGYWLDGTTKQGNGEIHVNTYGSIENALDSFFHEYRHSQVHKGLREEMRYNILFPNNPEHRHVLKVLEKDASEYAAEQVRLFKLRHLELFLDNSKKIEL